VDPDRAGAQHNAKQSWADERSTAAVVLRVELDKACGVLTVSDSGDGDLAFFHADGGEISHKPYRALTEATVCLALEDLEGMIPLRAP
jgi:hypothetical protein